MRPRRMEYILLFKILFTTSLSMRTNVIFQKDYEVTDELLDTHVSCSDKKNNSLMKDKILFNDELRQEIPVSLQEKGNLFLKRNRRGVFKEAPIKVGALRIQLLNSDNTSLSDSRMLANFLLTSVSSTMAKCDLLIAFDKTFNDPLLLSVLSSLPNTKQVIFLTGLNDLRSLLWDSGQCRGYIFMVSDLNPLLNFLNNFTVEWDYQGRYIICGLSLQELSQIAKSSKGMKTQHLIGAVKVDSPSTWYIYRSRLYFQEQRRVGVWRRNKLSSETNLFPDELSNLRGIKLMASTFKWEPNVFYSLMQNGSLLDRYGVDIEVSRTLAKFFNFSLEFIEPPAGQLWGDKQIDGSWNGMMGQLTRGEADFGIASIYVSLARAEAVHYTVPYDSRMSCFMIRRDPPVPKWRALTLPFELKTWMAIVGGIMISGPAISLFASSSQQSGSEIPAFRLLWNAYFYSLGLHFRHTQYQLPLKDVTKVILLFFWIYTMVLTIFYSTSLMAYMIVNIPPPSIETIEGLYKSGLEVAGLGFFYKNALASASDPHLQSLVKTYKGHSVVDTIFQEVHRGKSVFLQNREYIEFIAASKFTTKGVTSVRIMKECFAPFSIAMAVQKHSPLKTKFDKVIGWLQQSGLIRQFFLRSLMMTWSSKEYSGQGQLEQGQESGYTESEMDKNTALSLNHLQGLFFIEAFGLLLSIIVFLFELKLGRVTERAMTVLKREEHFHIISKRL
ncbi:ionotropic receptor 21a-like [Palaemon carinicauda]|uniref:ionotropic receptor 21a-like n=1 Tax=Palaemon carinicauda TaxID=392227 RepID=UPI0035B5AA5A